MANVMQYKQVLTTYQQLLEANTGKALLIGEGTVAILEDGCVVCAPSGLMASLRRTARMILIRAPSSVKRDGGTAKRRINCCRVSTPRHS